MQSNPSAREPQRATLEETAANQIPALRAFARNFYRDPDNIDDLVQETLTKSIAKMHQFTPGTSMKSWLFTIMRNTFYTARKNAAREAPGAADCVSDRPSVNPDQEWHLRGRELSEALNRLPASHRNILILIGVYGISYKETARRCGCAMGTVKSRLYRAREKLVEELREESIASSLHALPDYTNPELVSHKTKH